MVSPSRTRPSSPIICAEHMGRRPSPHIRSIFHPSGLGDGLARSLPLPHRNGSNLSSQAHALLPSCIANTHCRSIFAPSPPFPCSPKKDGAAYRSPLREVAPATSTTHAWVARNASAALRLASRAHFRNAASMTCVRATPRIILPASKQAPPSPQGVSMVTVSVYLPSRIGLILSARHAQSDELRAESSGGQQTNVSSSSNACAYSTCLRIGRKVPIPPTKA